MGLNMLLKIFPDTILLLIVILGLSVGLFFEIRAVESSIVDRLADVWMSTQVRLLAQEKRISVMERQMEIYREEFSAKLSEVADRFD